MAFDESEKNRILYHLGYGATVETFALYGGVGFVLPYLPVVMTNIERLRPGAEDHVRTLLARLDETETMMFENQELLAIDKIDVIDVRPDGQQRYRNQYEYWQAALGNVLQVEVNPYDQRRGVGARVNIPVNHGG